MRKHIILVLLLCQYWLASAQHVGNKKYAKYFNARFAYNIKYPSRLLTPQPEAYNGDGRKFTDKNYKNILVVYGCRSVNIETDLALPFKQVYNDELKGGRFNTYPNRKVLYSKYTPYYFVITGTDGGNIFYQKTILLTGENSDCIAYAILTYPAEEKQLYDDVSKQVFLSFKEVAVTREYEYIK